MKTLICIPCLLTGGTEIQTLNTVHALVLGGHEVTVACYFEHTPDMVARYRKAGAEVLLFSPEGVRVGGYKSILFLYKNLRSVVKAVRPDIVHVQYMAPGAMVILLLWLLGVRNIIATVHTAADIYKDLRLIHFIQRHCVRAWICITERAERSFFGTSQLYSKDMVLGKRNHFTIYNSLPVQLGGSCNENENEDENYAAEQRLIAISSQVKGDGGEVKQSHLKGNLSSSSLSSSSRLGVNQSQSHLKGNLSSSSLSSSSQKEPLAPFVLGVVSRLEHIKGMDLVIPAFAEVRRRFPDVRLLVVGDGSLRGSMEQQAQELGCADAVTWAGRQPQESLPQYYGEMDIVLMPSRSEGFGLTAIEAMACGCVVVASDVGGLPEVVRDGICGFLHRTEDVADMAEKICSLIASSELYRSLQKNALRHVQKFSFQRYAELIHNLYGKL